MPRTVLQSRGAYRGLWDLNSWNLAISGRLDRDFGAGWDSDLGLEADLVME